MSLHPQVSLRALLEECKLLKNAKQVEESLYELQWGSALLVVGIKGRALVVISPLFKGLPPTRQDEFCRRLLELNSTLGGVASFAVQPDGWVVLHGGRDVKGMDAEEFGIILAAIAQAADYFDNMLLDEFYSAVAPGAADESA